MEQDLSKVPRRLRRFYRRGQIPPQQLARPEDVPKQAKIEFKREASQKALDDISSFKRKHKRMPKAKEYNNIAEKLFNKLKKEAREQVLEERKGERRGRKFPAKEKQKYQRPLKAEKPRAGESLEAEKEAMFGEEKPGNLEALDLSGLDFSDEASIDLDNIEDDESILKETENHKNTCPNCKNKSDNILFCPSCGSAFCNHCAAKAKKLEKQILYQCPKCGKQFKARKIEP